jgi:hypothetical protein
VIQGNQIVKHVSKVARVALVHSSLHRDHGRMHCRHIAFRPGWPSTRRAKRPQPRPAGYRETAVVLDADDATIAVPHGVGAGIHTLDSGHDKAYTRLACRLRLTARLSARPGCRSDSAKKSSPAPIAAGLSIRTLIAGVAARHTVITIALLQTLCSPQELRARLVNISVLALHSSFDARDQVVYFKRLSEQARSTCRGGVCLQVGV